MIGGFRVFDCHLHLQPWEMLLPGVRERMIHGRADVEEILAFQRDPAAFDAFLAREGVDRAVLVNYVSPDVMGFTGDVNAWIARYAAGRERLVPMGSVHPRLVRNGADAVDELVQKLGIRALKVHPSHQLLYPHAYRDGDVVQRGIYEAAEEHGVPVTFHTGTSVFPGARNRYADPIFVDDVAVDFPELPIVLAHAGRPLWMETAVFLARRHDNVHLDLSGIPPSKLLDYLPRLPELAHKAMFGTDWPGPGIRSVRANVEAFLGLPLRDEAKRAMLWGNAARLFGA